LEIALQSWHLDREELLIDIPVYVTTNFSFRRNDGFNTEMEDVKRGNR